MEMKKTRKIVINTCYGGFSLSRKATTLLARKLGVSRYDIEHFGYERDCEELVEVVEELGEAANGAFTRLKVVEVPAYIKWEIKEYDGVETIHEKHRMWC